MLFSALRETQTQAPSNGVKTEEEEEEEYNNIIKGQLERQRTSFVLTFSMLQYKKREKRRKKD